MDWLKEVAFVCLMNFRPLVGVLSPKNYTQKPYSAETPAEWTNLNNFWKYKIAQNVNETWI